MSEWTGNGGEHGARGCDGTLVRHGQRVVPGAGVHGGRGAIAAVAETAVAAGTPPRRGRAHLRPGEAHVRWFSKTTQGKGFDMQRLSAMHRVMINTLLPLCLFIFIPDPGSGQIALNAVAASSTEITLTWTGDDNVGHQIQWNLGTTAPDPWPSSTESNTINVDAQAPAGIGQQVSYTQAHTGLAGGTTYWYRIRATTPDHTSGPDWPTSGTPVTSATTNATGSTPLDLPTDFAVASGTGSVGNDAGTVDITWTALANIVYEIQWADDAAMTNPMSLTDSKLAGGTAETRTITHTDRTLGQEYWYQIRAASSTDDTNLTPSSWTTATSAVVGGQLDPVTGLSATLNETTTATVAWDKHSIATTYGLEWSTDESGPWNMDIADITPDQPNEPTVSFDHTGRTAETTYWYRVTAKLPAVAGVLESEWATTSTDASVLPVPDPVTGFAAIARSASTIRLTWDAHGAHVSFELQHNRISATPPNDADWEETGTPVATAQLHDHTGLTAGTQYWYRIRAKNTTGGLTSTWSAVETATTLSTPDPPTGLIATADATGITLNWRAPVEEGTTAIKNYKIEKSEDESTWETLTTVGVVLTYKDATAPAGKTTYYRVFAVNDAGDSPASNTASAMMSSGELSAPRNLTAAVGTTGTTLNWEAPADAGTSAIKNYKIQQSSDAGTNWIALATVGNVLTYLHASAPAGTTHYRVFAVNDEGEGPASNTASATKASTTKKPGAPTGLSAVSGAGGITLNWQAPADSGSSAIKNYRVEQSVNAGSTWASLATVGGTITTYLHTGVGPDKTVHYRVFAINTQGDSPASNTASAMTGRDIPTAPRNLTGQATDDGNMLSWQTPADTGSAAITSYRVEQSTDGGASWTTLFLTAGSATSYLHRSPTPGRTTQYRVFAINARGDSPASNTVSVETEANAPHRPTDLSASVSGDVVRLSWSAPRNDGGAAITGYRIEITRFAEAAWSTLIANTESAETSYSHKATPGSTLSYRVFAINSAGRSLSSNIARAQVGAVPPDAPGGVGALAQSHNAIGLAWNPPENTGGAPVTSYRIEYSNDGAFWSVLASNFRATSTSYRHTDLEPATTYHYRVFATNKAGMSPPSEVVRAKTHADLPSVPERVAAKAVGATQINVTWREPRYTGGVEIETYEVETSDDGNTWVLLVSTPGDETIYQHKGLTPATTYHYRVTAVNDVGSSRVSRPVFAKTTADVPDEPTYLKATAQSHQEISLTWSPPDYDGGSRITGYLIEYSSNDGATWDAVRKNTGSASTTYTHGGLTRGTLYYYRVAAINKIGTGERSEVAEAKTFALKPSAPYDLKAKVKSSTQIDLSWTVPEDDGGAEITRYLIESSRDLVEWERLADVERGVEYSHTEVTPGETWHYRVLARNEAGYSPPSNIASATTDDPVQRTERVINAILPRFTLTAVNSSLRAISTRIELVAKDRPASNRLNVVGGEDGLQGIANGSSVTQPVGGASIWGSADLAGLKEETGEVDWDGEVFSIHAGVDGMIRDGILVGIAASRSRGGFNFMDRTGGKEVDGDFSANLTTINPYLAWVSRSAGVWTVTGFGRGEMDISDEAADRSSTLANSMVAVGGFRHLVTGPIGAFHIRAEGMTVLVEVTGNVPSDLRTGTDPDHINESQLRLGRGRMMLDWAVPRKAYGEYQAEVHFQGGMRRDYNELDTGVSGAEFGGGLKLTGPIFRAHGNARIFMHSDQREWGIQGLLELRSRSESGLSLRVSPAYGNAQSGLNQLWERGAENMTVSGSRSGRMSAVLEYQKAGLSPYSGVNFRGKQTDIQAGLLFRLETLDLEAEAVRRDGKAGLSLRMKSSH